MRPSSPLLDSVQDRFEDAETLTRDFSKHFKNSAENMSINVKLFDITFLVGQKDKLRFYGVRAILGVRSRSVFNFELRCAIGIRYFVII